MNRSLTRIAAVVVAVAALGAAVAPAPASANHAPARPYIAEPGVQDVIDPGGRSIRITAYVVCDRWKGVAELLIGTKGYRMDTRRKYICQTQDETLVTYTIRVKDLRGFKGRWQYTIRVGRHDQAGNPVIWTDSGKGYFTYS